MKALRLPTGASTAAYFFRFRRPRDPPVFCVRRGAPGGLEDPSQPGHLGAGRPQCRLLTWTPIGSLRYPGDPSCAFAPLLDPGRTDVPLPWRSHRCCPRLIKQRRLRAMRISGSITQLQHLLSYASRFVLPLTRKAGFRLAGWPLPGGCRTLWTTVRGFSLHGHPPLLAS